MKKVITGLLVLLCISALTGCGKDDVTLTNEDNDLVAEYIAGTLLKYSYDNEWKYQKLNSAQNGGGTISSSGIQKPSQTQSAITGHNNTIQTTKASGNSANASADSSSSAASDVYKRQIQYRLLRRQVIQRTHQQIY